MYKNIKLLFAHFPTYFNNTGQQDPVPQPGLEIENTNDQEVSSVSAVDFDVHTGLWKGKSLSDHVPLDMADPKLNSATFNRLSYIKDSPFGGGFTGPKLVALHVTEGGEPLEYYCGAVFLDEPIFDFRCKLYTRNVSIVL